MGLHRDIERILARPADSLLLREIIVFWGEHRSESHTAGEIASRLHRSSSQVASLLGELESLGVLSRRDDEADTVYSYRLSGTQAFEIEQFARSRSFHQKKLIRSTDRFRTMYQRKPPE